MPVHSEHATSKIEVQGIALFELKHVLEVDCVFLSFNLGHEDVHVSRVGFINAQGALVHNEHSQEEAVV